MKAEQKGGARSHLPEPHAPGARGDLILVDEDLGRPAAQDVVGFADLALRDDVLPDKMLLCVVRDANMGHQLAGGNSSWCPELEWRQST